LLLNLVSCDEGSESFLLSFSLLKTKQKITIKQTKKKKWNLAMLHEPKDIYRPRSRDSFNSIQIKVIALQLNSAISVLFIQFFFLIFFFLVDISVITISLTWEKYQLRWSSYYFISIYLSFYLWTFYLHTSLNLQVNKEKTKKIKQWKGKHG